MVRSLAVERSVNPAARIMMVKSKAIVQERSKVEKQSSERQRGSERVSAQFFKAPLSKDSAVEFHFRHSTEKYHFKAVY